MKSSQQSNFQKEKIYISLLPLLKPIELSIKFDTVKPEWFVCIYTPQNN